MIHKVSELCDMIDVMYKDSQELRRMKYEEPKADTVAIDQKIAQIQYMALLVSNDKQPYEKTK